MGQPVMAVRPGDGRGLFAERRNRFVDCSRLGGRIGIWTSGTYRAPEHSYLVGIDLRGVGIIDLLHAVYRPARTCDNFGYQFRSLDTGAIRRTRTIETAVDIAPRALGL